MRKIFIDMDGTLAEFKPCDTLEKLYEEGYFRNLKPQMSVVEAAKELIASEEFDVYVLSAVFTDSKYALKEKNEWLDEYLPEIPPEKRIFPPCGEDKKKYVDMKEGDLLLDDYTKNLLDWEPPGTAIKLLNGINHSNESWDGNCIAGIETDGNVIVEKIKNISNGNITRDIKPQHEKELDTFCESITTGMESIFSLHNKEISNVNISVEKMTVPYIAGDNFSDSSIIENAFGSLHGSGYLIRMHIQDEFGNKILDFEKITTVAELKDELKNSFAEMKEKENVIKHRKGR